MINIRKNESAIHTRGMSLLELMLALGIFSLIILVTFLPFKIIRDAERTGTSRIDPQLALRNSLQRLVRDLRRGYIVGLSDESPANSRCYRRAVLFRDYNRTERITYALAAVAANEYRLTEQKDTLENGVWRQGPVRAIIPKGVSAFYVRPPSPSPPVPTAGALLQLYVQVYTDDTRRPLPPSPAPGFKLPMEFATSLAIRN
jgi:prepilin-type N-terminal cleavage/methylation domain-containing protein